MEKHCTIVTFTLRESKRNKKGLCPIEMTISINSERVVYSVGKFATPETWNSKKQLVKGKSSEAALINDYLVNLRNRVYQKEIELREHNFSVSPTLLKDALLDKIDALNEKTLLGFLSEYIDNRSKFVGTTLAPATFYVFKHTKNLLCQFILSSFSRVDVLLREVNLSFIQGWHGFLMTRMCHNTATKHLSFLKSLMTLAAANGYVQYNMIQSYKIERFINEVDFLDEFELKRFMEFESVKPNLMVAKDMFVFGCFTGLSFIDIKNLGVQHLFFDAEHRAWIRKKREKTGVLSRIPLLPQAKAIMVKYASLEYRLVPFQDASDVNKNIKEIAKACGISKHITFHTSRHTFATTVTLSNKIPLEVVSSMMGHTNTRMTSHYAKLVDKAIAEQMDALTVASLKFH